jgi:molecular chaperone GrpE
MAGRDFESDRQGPDQADADNSPEGGAGVESGVSVAVEGRVTGLEADLAGQLTRAQAQAAEYLDSWRRSVAELSNARKRMQREQTEMSAVATARVLERLIPIVDDVQRAFSSLPADAAASDWVAGFRLIQRKLEGLLESEGVTTIAAEGKRFDPAVHFAVSLEYQPGYGDGDIIAEVSRGYLLGDRVLRPSMVRVARGQDGAEARDAA